MRAVVLAGGPADDEVARLQPGAASKAFVRVAGLPLVERVLRGLREARTIDAIRVVAPVEAFGDSTLSGVELRASGERMVDSMRSALEGLDPDIAVLAVASDVALLTGEVVDAFVRDALALDADLVYAMVRKETHVARYPELPHTWAPLREGTFCGGGFVTIKPRALPSIVEAIETFGAARKSPLKLAGLLGWGTIWRFAARRLSVTYVQGRVRALTGIDARGLEARHAEAAVNVDRASDVAAVERLIAEGRTPVS
ncbi:MAG TPA: NTP transferase domain-containing protein [Candidatus Dormibacteraeota bacterium]|nr:NTP transferase domain-containing protein [Candidatus Dormibacteraeota bacterium]